MDVRIDGEVIVMMIGVEMVAHYLTTGLKYQAFKIHLFLIPQTIIRKISTFFATNSDFLILISLQPNVVDLR